MDEIHSEILKALDIVGLSWLTCLFSVMRRSGTVPVEWQTGVVVQIIKKGDWNYRGITLLGLSGKVYSRVLERRLRPTVGAMRIPSLPLNSGLALYLSLPIQCTSVL